MTEKKYKILLIEDDKFLIKLYSEKLAREGFDVLMAITGEEGLKRVETDSPDLVLLDVILPHKNGFDVLSELKLNPKTKKIPVVMLTNLGQENDIKNALDLGALDYLIKTEISINAIPEKVRHYLALQKK
ncbi:MAG: response regulator [bacterium]|nr:response regulator [bacterium]